VLLEIRRTLKRMVAKLKITVINYVHLRAVKRAQYIIALFLVIIASEVSAQAKERPIKKDNMHIDLSYEGLVNRPGNVRFPFGYGFQVQYLYDKGLKAKPLSIALGLGYSNANYFNNAYLTHKDADGNDFTSFNPIPSDSSYKRNKYVTNYLDIPFEFRFRSARDSKGHSWKLSVGFKVGFRLGSRSQTITDEGKYADFIHPNLSKTRYGLTYRFGYGRVGVFGYHSLTPFFENNRGQEMIPYSVGFTISPF
jgi:hypothetical protein